MSNFPDEPINRAASEKVIEPDKVGENAEKLANSTLGELSDALVKHGEDVLKQLGLPCDNARSLRFGQLLCLKRTQCCESRSDDPAASLLPLLTDAGSTVIKQFMASTLAAFAEFSDVKTGLPRARSVLNRVRFIAEHELNISVAPVITVRELLSYFADMTKWTNWDTDTPLGEFYRRAKACCLIIKLILIDCFRFAFGELFFYGELKAELEHPDDLFIEIDEYDGEYSEKYDINRFGDEYDTEAEDFLIGGEKMRLEEEKRMAREWNEARFRILGLTDKRK